MLVNMKNNKVKFNNTKGILSKNENNFIIKIKTNNTGASNDNQFRLPLRSTFAYDFNIDWGDNTREHISTSSSVTHTYPAEGTYTIRINGWFPLIYFNNTGDKLKLIEIKSWGDGKIKWTSFENAFFGCTNMICTAPDTPNTSTIKKFSRAFRDCPNFDSASISHMNTSSATTMFEMFRGCTRFNQSLYFNTTNCTTMKRMFMGCSYFNGDISTFDTLNVTDFTAMFLRAYRFNHSINHFDLSSATLCGSMFYNNYHFNQPVNNLNTSSVKSFYRMFYGCSVFNQDVSSWNISSLTAAGQMLKNTAFDTTNYDKLLDAWEGQPHNDNVAFESPAKYTSGSTAEAARNRLINDDGWTITDGGPV